MPANTGSLQVDVRGFMSRVLGYVIAFGAGALALASVQAQSRQAAAPALTPFDYIEIQQLVAQYSYALDTGADNGYMYADLFAPDGVMHSRLNGQEAETDFAGHVYVKTDKGWRFKRREMVRVQSGPSTVPTPGPR